MYWRNAVARVEVEQGAKPVRSGTAFLVTPDLALTALHVVADRGPEPPAFFKGPIHLHFPGHETVATVVQDRYDRWADWVLLRLDRPAPARPLPLRQEVEEGVEWKTHGYPDANPADGMDCWGRVRATNHAIGGARALQLFCEEASGGQGMRVKGLSGAPVVVEGAVVGVLRRALLEGDRQVDIVDSPPRSVAGTLFACPVTTVLARCADLLPVAGPTTPVVGTGAFPPLPEHERHTRERYLREVRKDLGKRWRASLHRAVFLDLGLETAVGSTRLPWDNVDLKDASRTYPKVEEAFAYYERRLLILGEPGAGKTTSLLRLAEEMLSAAEKDPTAPVPLVVNLSVYRPRRPLAPRVGRRWWRRQNVARDQPTAANEEANVVADGDVERWLAEQMARYPGVSFSQARRWLTEGRVGVFLDGLDEVKGEFRERLVRLLNSTAQ
jgi:hypothetical protein